MTWCALLVTLLAVPAAAGAAGVVPAGGWGPTGTPPLPAGSVRGSLDSVSCAGASCTAVGSAAAGGSTVGVADHWNGTAWAGESFPTAAAGAQVYPQGVSCGAPAACVAVGYTVTTTSTRTTVAALAARDDGGRWRTVAVPLPVPAGWAELSAVSCTGPADCTAVGGLIGNGASAQEQPLAEHWNGTAWSPEAVPNPHAENGSALTAVSCTDPSACTAAGGYTYADVGEAVLAFRWNGSAWSRQVQANPVGGELNTDAGVACPTVTWCTSVGTWQDGHGRTDPLVEVWAGGPWTRVADPGPAGSDVTTASGVSCTSPTSCTWVGSVADNFNGYPAAAAAEAWDGTAWQGQPVPVPAGDTDSSLQSVSCTAGGACLAVGGASAHADAVVPLAETVGAPAT